jgi:SPW repeat-containing protein
VTPELPVNAASFLGSTSLSPGDSSMKRWRRESALDTYNLAAAVILFVAPWLFSLTNGTARLDFWLCALAIIAMSSAAIFTYANWEEWTNVIVGLWLIASPWILGFAHLRAMHFSVAIGIIVTFMSLLELFLVNESSLDHAPSPPPGQS